MEPVEGDLALLRQEVRERVLEVMIMGPAAEISEAEAIEIANRV